MNAQLKKITDKFGKGILRKSAFEREGNVEILEKILDGRYYGCIVEIGTGDGVSASFLAKYCDKLNTFDIKDSQIAINLWTYLDLQNVNYYVIDDIDKFHIHFNRDIDSGSVSENIITLIALESFGDFDFAFIDGDHTGERPHKDFMLVKRCGRVLFHDRTRDAVKAVIDSLPEDEVTTIDNFAYWEKKEYANFANAIKQNLEINKSIEKFKKTLRGEKK